MLHFFNGYIGTIIQKDHSVFTIRIKLYKNKQLDPEDEGIMTLLKHL
jgi:hypothetical protein